MSRASYYAGRPPYDSAEPTQCEYLDDRGRQCGLPAMWLIPEYPTCRNHIPEDLRAVMFARELRWQEDAGWLWTQIVREVPVP